MDPLTTSALTATLTALLNGVAGEAGKSAWASLTATARSAFGGKSTQVRAIEAAQLAVATPSDPAGLADLAEAAAGQLLAGAQADRGFGEFLAGWQAEATTLVQGSDSVTNVVSGNAQVRSLIQARDLHGDITFT